MAYITMADLTRGLGQAQDSSALRAQAAQIEQTATGLDQQAQAQLAASTDPSDASAQAAGGLQSQAAAMHAQAAALNAQADQIDSQASQKAILGLTSTLVTAGAQVGGAAIQANSARQGRPLQMQPMAGGYYAPPAPGMSAGAVLGILGGLAAVAGVIYVATRPQD